MADKVQRAIPKLSALNAFGSVGRDQIARTHGDQGRPKKKREKKEGVALKIPEYPKPQSAGSIPAGHGHPDNQPQRPGTQPDPYDSQYRPAGQPYSPESAFGSPHSGDHRRGESAEYYAGHPGGSQAHSQAQGGYFAAPSDASQPYPSQHPQQVPYTVPPPGQSPQQGASQHSQSGYGTSPPQPQQQRSMQEQYPSPDHYSHKSSQPPLPRHQSMQEHYSSPRSAQPSRTSSTPGPVYRSNPPYQQPCYAPYSEPAQSVLSSPYVAEPEMLPSSRNPQQGNCASCGYQRFLNPMLGICSTCQGYRSNVR